LGQGFIGVKQYRFMDRAKEAAIFTIYKADEFGK
jgi:hypothetical protein